MSTVTNRKDRRTQRTLVLLRNGFIEAMREKGFAAMSIQDITDRANVNRGTFYIHYADKYMLLDEIVRDNFRNMLQKQALLPGSRWDKETLQRIIVTVLSCFEGKYRHRPPSARFPAALLEQTIHEELNGAILQLIEQDKGRESNPSQQAEARARVIGWAIFGTAIQWSQEPVGVPIDQMANTILSVITDGGPTS
ncbi:TetR/AcrR family transcriptional regulator [Paenibacillus allorhizosphaerae]|uniref:HTH tetR-type domain-containing protein n=1 Tax=Paenibacillus allorhizosphaerae TaxID=2849866 RepID=A0ABN7TXH9_9BACL|nr:TetR/AcrR family transcriptional regulator [Paenibacillus allorhizosphaerae]CAG7654784.1 hypothetical protein PAECIP111802_05875 [Paenibacillus allorhizosphaerae]